MKTTISNFNGVTLGDILKLLRADDYIKITDQFSNIHFEGQRDVAYRVLPVRFYDLEVLEIVQDRTIQLCVKVTDVDESPQIVLRQSVLSYTFCNIFKDISVHPILGTKVHFSYKGNERDTDVEISCPKYLEKMVKDKLRMYPGIFL